MGLSVDALAERAMRRHAASIHAMASTAPASTPRLALARDGVSYARHD